MAEAPDASASEAVVEHPSTQPSAGSTSVAESYSDDESSAAAAPATQPTNGKSSVTEVSTEEAAPDSGE